MPLPSPAPSAWLCEFIREDDTIDRQVLLEDPECTRWADCADGDGVSPYRVTPLYAAVPVAQLVEAGMQKSDKANLASASGGNDLLSAAAKREPA